MSISESWKALGNHAFKAGDYATAIQHYSQAIEADPNVATSYVNRSLAYFHIHNWAESIRDAQTAIRLDSKYVKAHYRFVKALFKLPKWKEARMALLYGLKECGDCKDLKELEQEIFQLTSIPLRPKVTDFEVIHELGDGNFSKVYKTYLKATKQVFAIKAIEKAVVDKMKRRHPNIHNEILMEKRVLQKLDHPGITTLYATFQDYGTLYYQMDFVGGGDLWTNLHELIVDSSSSAAPAAAPAREADAAELDEEVPFRRASTGPQLGAHWSQLRFYVAQMLSVIEHLHRRGIVHRDLKPENIMISESGFLKFIDFGTAKDLFQPDLNGPEFVGTPDYMCPQTVKSKGNNRVGIESDIWALGVILFQMITGFTPFRASSPFLSFLRIKRAKVMIPSFVPQSVADFIRMLLIRDSQERIFAATGISDCTVDSLHTISYDKVRSHPFFQDWRSTVHLPRTQFYTRANEALQQELTAHYLSATHEADSLCRVEDIQQVYQQVAERVPSLHDLCIRAVGEATVKIAFAVSENGGIKPKTPWIQAFDHKRMTAVDRERVMHYLESKSKLQVPGIHRLFFDSLPDSRCLRTSTSMRSYVGLTHALQGNCKKEFHFSQLANPLISATVASREEMFKANISSVNKLRPKVLVVLGSFTDVPCDHADYLPAVDRFRKCMARVSDTIPVVFVPGPHEVGHVPTTESIRRYHALFGADYFGFWYEGMRGLVINSSLMISPQLAPELAQEQDAWLEEEIEQAKLCSCSINVFTYHPWFYQDLDEEDLSDGSPGKSRNFPRDMRWKWLQRLRHHKVRFCFSSASAAPSSDPSAVTAEQPTADSTATDAATSSAPRFSRRVLRPFTGRTVVDPAEEEESAEVDESGQVADESPAAESEAISTPQKEPPAENVPAPAATVEEEERREVTEAEAVKDADDLSVASASSSASSEDSEYRNEESACEGPELLFTPAIVGQDPAETSTSSVSASAATATIAASVPMFRMVYMREDCAQQTTFASAEQVPKSMQELINSWGK